MKHTLVAAFATLTDANRTRGDLMARGIPREQIHAVGAESADIHAYDAPYSTTPDTPVDRTEHESKVAHFFKSLFGHEPHEQHRHHATAYPEAVRRGALVIAVDVVDEDQLAKARDALEYNGAIDIDEHGATGTADGYPGPTSPYAGATGGDSHLDKHFTGQQTHHAGAMAGRHGESETLGAGSSASRTTEQDTGSHGIGSAGKRAGTDYPPTTATTAPTGAGSSGHGASASTPEVAPGVGTRESGLCRDRICVIQRPS
ncbi:hypothetical protein ACP6JA_12665 [Stutzerimonas frequens]|jgi:hypothetical protein|nr:hypothetical protein [Stutzerimonas balearica]